MSTQEQSEDISQPTPEQCNTHAKVWENDTRVGYAIWYPQMGGYGSVAVALMDKHWEAYPNGAHCGGCVDVLVWHDGEFPFGEGEPREIHHCAPAQFIEFGETLDRLNELGRKDV